MQIIRRIIFPFVTVATIANALGTAVIFLLVSAMSADVVARNFFNAPLLGVVEVVIFSLILIVFLQLPDVVRHNRLTRSDGFLVLAGHKYPKVAFVLGRSIDLIAAIFMMLITWTMWPEFIESIETCHFITPPEFGPPPTGDILADLRIAFARCEYFGTPGVFTAPWWPAKMAIVFSTALCSVILLFKAGFGNGYFVTPSDKEMAK